MVKLFNETQTKQIVGKFQILQFSVGTILHVNFRY